jgi:hypothetical protein
MGFHVTQRRKLLSVLLLACSAAAALNGQPLQWTPQGASPNRHGQVENINGEEVTGGIQALAVHPTDPAIVYVGAVNGGIWKSLNAMDAVPKWREMIDHEESMSVGAIAFDPTDAAHQTVVSGMGRFSSLAQAGGSRSGLLRTTDGGANWKRIDVVKGLNISGVAPRGATIVVAANDADDPNLLFPNGPSKSAGVWRTDGATWVQLSGDANTGLPAGPCSSLASDPAVPARLYVNAWTAGIFRSDDTGAKWHKVSSAEMDGFISSADNLKISVGAGGGVYVAIDSSGRLAALFHSPDGENNWTGMSLPGLDEGGIHPGGQGAIHLALAANPRNANIVYVGGDRQPAKFVNGQETPLSDGDEPVWPNAIGAMDYTGRIFRGDSSLPAANQWVHITHSNTAGPQGGGTAHSSAPHADSRGLALAANGMLIAVNDGGIYRQSSPGTNTGDWFSMNGDLQVGEFHTVAWDSNNHTIVAGAQDTGTPEQHQRSDTAWESISTGDGGVVMVDSTSTPGRSIRYTSYYNLGSFRREEYDHSNTLQRRDYPKLIVQNSNPPVRVAAQFYTPIKLNAVDPTRMILGGQSVYESLDQGDTVAEIAPRLALNENGANPIAYGAANNSDMLYVGAVAQVYVRQKAPPSPLTPSASYKGGYVLGIVMDPSRAEVAFVVSPNHVSQTANAGKKWTDITGNLPVGQGILRSIAYAKLDPAGDLVVGTDKGVFVAKSPAFSHWSPLGTGLPNAPVYHLEYSESDRVLLAGTLGRGAWTLQFPAPPPAVPPGVFITTLRRSPRTPQQAPQAGSSRSAAALPPPPPAPPSQPPKQKFQLAPGIVVDAAQGQIYSMDVNGGIKDVDVKTGQAVWNTKDASRPLGFVGNRLLGQMQHLIPNNALEVADLDPLTGKALSSTSAALPPQVVPSVVPTLKGDFAAFADTLPNGDAVISWQYLQHTARALPPGTKPTLPPADGVSSQTAGPGSLLRGAFRLDRATGLMQQMSAAAAPSVPPELISPQPQPSGDAQNRQFLSADGRHYLVSQRNAGMSGTQKYTLTVYDRQSGARIGAFQSPVAAVPFYVTDSRAVYELGPSQQRTAAGLVEQPRTIRAVDLGTGNEVWSTPVRDSTYRGPVPP